MSDWWYPGQLARQDQYGDVPPADWPIMDRDPFEAAALRTRQSVRPEGGRDEAPGQILGPLTEHLVLNPLRKGQRLLQTNVDADAEMRPVQSGIPSISTDYDPRRASADMAAGTAFNLVGTPGGAGGLGAGARLPKTALPVDETSRTARAVEQGFTRDAYRGEGAPITGGEFQVGHPGRYDPGFLGGEGIYSTNAPRLANDYSTFKAAREMPGNEAPNVMPLKVKMENPLVISGEDKTRIAKMDRFDRDDWLRGVYGKGHDGVLVKYPGGYEEYVAPAAQYRSRFAQFDPANKDSGFLLGANAVDKKTGAALAAAKIGGLASPAHKTGTVAEQTGLARPSIIERYVTDPQRIYKPGIYKRPDVIAKEASEMVAPEHEALKKLFGVTRDDLYEISKQGTRQGNITDPGLFQPKKPGGSYAAENIMNPANAQRLIDTLTEARKYPGLERGMIPWYVMDPAYQRMVKLVGPERAKAEYDIFNSMMTPFSASSDVMKEINRGTAARMMNERGQYPDFVKFGGGPVEKRGADFPPEMVDVIPHLRHAPTHTDPVSKFIATGKHGYGDDTVKIPLYTQASGVPQTGFQTRFPVPDAHFTRAVGMSDVRKNAGPGDYMGGSEYRTFGPWFRQNVSDKMGIEAVPGQALTWGAYAPQTGVKTPIGAGKLELLSQRIWERAKKLGIDPKVLRDRVLRGEDHATLMGPGAVMGGIAAQDNYGQA